VGRTELTLRARGKVPVVTHSRTRALGNWQERFLRAFADTGLVTDACKRAGVSRTGAYKARRRDPEFAERWAEIEARVIEKLERAAIERALNGSDRLLEFLLRSWRPSVYRERIGRRDPGPANLTLAQIITSEVAAMSAAERDAELRRLGYGVPEHRALRDESGTSVTRDLWPRSQRLPGGLGE
jgi:hypothetical protein